MKNRYTAAFVGFVADAVRMRMGVRTIQQRN